MHQSSTQLIFKTLFLFGRLFRSLSWSSRKKVRTFLLFMVGWIRKMVAGLSIREPEEVGITDARVISELALKLKMLDATSFFPEYRSFKNKLTTKKPSKSRFHARPNCR